MTQAELLAELERLVAEATVARERLRELGVALALVRAQLVDPGSSEAASLNAPS